MITEEELLAQNQQPLSLQTQAIHKKRFFLLVIAFFVYVIFDSFVFSFFFYLFMLFLMAKLFPLKVKEKDDLVHYILAERVERMFKKLYPILRKVSIKVMTLSILLSSIVNAQEQQQIPPVNLPPPPQSFNQQQQPSQQQPQVIEMEVQDLPAPLLDMYIKQSEIRGLVKDQQRNLSYGSVKTLFLKDTNHFSYIPQLPVLFLFDVPVKRVIYVSQGAKVVYEDNYIFLLPPSEIEGKLFAFVAVIGNQPRYFVGERVTSIDNIKQDLLKADTKLDKAIEKGEKREVVQTVERVVIPFYKFVSQTYLTPSEILEVFLKDRKRCPIDGETFSLEGQTYRFVKKQGNVVKEEGDIYACGNIFNIINIR